MPPGAMMGGPPPGLAQLPPGPPGMGAPPMGGGDPVSTLTAAVGQMDAQKQQQDAVATTMLMALASALQDQASPQAVAAQASPGPMLPATQGMAGS